jgi:hypothetical protein
VLEPSPQNFAWNLPQDIKLILSNVVSILHECNLFLIFLSEDYSSIFIIFFIAEASSIDSATSIAKFLAASASHMVASDGFFDPKFAKRTHLILRTPDISLESYFVLVRVLAHSIFFTSEFTVVGDTASQTIVLVADVAREIVALILIRIK